jgi:hypothetical protein
MNALIETSKKTTSKKARSIKAKLKAPSEHDVQAFDDPRKELRYLVSRYAGIMRTVQSMQSAAKDKTAKKDIPWRGLKAGDPIPSPLTDGAKVSIQIAVEDMKKEANALKPAMLRVLKQIPIYNLFLSKVYGVGPLFAAYAISQVDITISKNPSQLRRFFGLAVCNGRLERPTAGQKLPYNATLRTEMFKCMAGIWRNAAKTKSTSKYLKIWTDYKQRMRNSERYNEKSNTLQNFDADGFRKGAKYVIHATGWHKAADILLEDLYIVWRSIEGLDVRDPYRVEYLDRLHTGTERLPVPRTLLTVEQALDRVGYLGKVETNTTLEDIDLPDLDDDELEEAIADSV